MGKEAAKSKQARDFVGPAWGAAQNGRSSSGRFVVVMRHGERRDGGVDAPPEVDPPLTARGAAQVRGVAEEICAVVGHQRARKMRLLVSPFLRTRETAEELRKCGIGVGNPLFVDNRLCEVYGPLRIKTNSAPQFMNGAVSCDSGELPKWGESLEEASRRFVETFYRNSRLYPNEDLLLVTHGDALSAIFSAFYPERTMYMADYLSFIVFTEALSNAFELIESSGVEWVVDGPEIFSAETNKSRVSVVPTGVDTFVATQHADQFVNGHDSANSGLESMLHVEHCEGRGVNLTPCSLALRTLTVCSQILTLFAWPNKRNAFMYSLVVTMFELLRIILGLRGLFHPGYFEALDSVRHFYRLRRLFISFFGCGNSSRLLKILLLVCITAVKAMGIFILSTAFNCFAGLFFELHDSMPRSYAALFRSWPSFFVFVSFWVLDTFRRYHDVMCSLDGDEG